MSDNPYLLAELGFEDMSDEGGGYIGKTFSNGNTLFISGETDPSCFTVPDEDAGLFTWSIVNSDDECVASDQFIAANFDYYNTAVKEVIALHSKPLLQ